MCCRMEFNPRDILTREAFENAIASVAATGGSTNAVLHLLAIAREAGVELEIDDFQTVSTHSTARRSETFRAICGFRHASCGRHSAAGEAFGEWEACACVGENGNGQTIGAEAEERYRNSRTGSDRATRQATEGNWRAGDSEGNLAPEGCVAKISGHERLEQRGPARVFESEEDAMAAVTRKDSSGRRRSDSQRRTEGRSGHAGDAGRYGRDCGRRIGSVGRSVDRRALQRRDTGFDGGSRFSGGSAGRSHRRRARWRHDSLRC